MVEGRSGEKLFFEYRYAKGHVALPTLQCQLRRSPRATLHASSLPIPSNFQQEASTCPSHKLCGQGAHKVRGWGKSSTPCYPFQRQYEKQDQLLRDVPHAHVAGVDVADYTDSVARSSAILTFIPAIPHDTAKAFITKDINLPL